MSVNPLEIHNLTVRYQDADVLSDVSVTVKAGEHIGLVGPNGSGKTTLVRSSLGLARPQIGSIRLFGQDLARFRDWGRIGYLPQGVQMIEQSFPATAGEIVAMGLLAKKRLPRVITAQDRVLIDETLELLKISGLKDRPIGQLSGGQQQRVLLGRALVSRPELLFLDEPTAALDPQSRDVFYSVIAHLNKAHGTTVVLISHDIASVGVYASRLLYLDQKVIFFGGFDEFCRSEVMTNYFGQTTQHVICRRH